MSNLSIPGHCVDENDFNFTVSEDELVSCTPDQDIIYGDFGMDSTVVTRYNLVCDDQYKVLAEFSLCFFKNNISALSQKVNMYF